LQNSFLIPHKVKLIFFPTKILPIPAGRENIPKNATFPGENAAKEENVLENTVKHGENEVAMGKHPGFGRKTWRNCRRRRKCPRKCHKTWRKLCGGGETSWFWG
jgi:hypothetical protein